MALTAVKELIANTGVFWGGKFVIARTVLKLLDPFNRDSYSQFGEDRLLEHLLPRQGFYVDVGCNHPMRYSNSFLFYKRGWKGLCVDANKDLIQLHRKTRTRDSALCRLIGDKIADVVFTEFQDNLVSSADPKHVEEWKGRMAVRRTYTMKQEPLTQVLDTNNVPKSFDLLLIDVEGVDMAVLSSLNFDVYSPKVVVVEMHGFEIATAASNDVYAFMIARGYRLVGYCVASGIFQR